MTTVNADVLLLAAEYLQVREVAAKATKRQAELNSQLKALMIDFDADVAVLDRIDVGEEYVLAVANQCTAIEAETLQSLISKAMWNRITRQVLDQEKYRAEQATGRLKPEVVEAVEATSTVWQLRVFSQLPKQPVKARKNP